jgi:hypothetical protein
MKLRAGRLLRALGALIGLFVAVPVVLGYALSRLPAGTVELSLAAAALLAATLHILWPDWRSTSKCCGSPLEIVLLGASLGCLGIQELHIASEPVSDTLGVAGVVLFAAALIALRRRGKDMPGEATT